MSLYGSSPVLSSGEHVANEAIFLEAGTYEITAPETLTNTTHIIGVPGQTIIKATAAMDYMFYVTTDNVVIENVIIDGNSLAEEGVRFAGVDNLILRNVEVKNTTQNCVLGNGTGNTNVLLDRVRCSNGAVGKTFDSGSPSAWTWHNFYFDNIGIDNLRLENCEGALLLKATNDTVNNVTIWGGKYSNQEKMGIEVLIDTGDSVTNLTIGGGLEAKGNGYNAQISLNGVVGYHISDFHIDGVDNSTYGLEIVSCQSGIASNFTVTECTRNISCSGTNLYLAFCNFQSRNATGHYFFCQDADYVLIQGANLNGTDGSSAYGISFTNSDYVHIIGGILYGGSSTKAKKGVYINNSANHNDIVIQGLTIINWSEHSIYFDASTAVTLGRVKIGLNTELGNGAGVTFDGDITLSNDAIVTTGSID